jgi:hypothetical protein
MPSPLPRSTRSLRAAQALLGAAALLALPAHANEGKWTPQQVLDQGPAWVKAQGFALPLQSLWDPKTSRGLLSNAVQLPGCSGSFVSKDGLLITNHHCVLSILQEHSTAQQNLAKDGYLARTQAEEKKSASYRILVPKAFRDVTAEVQAAVPAGATDLARFQAVETAQKKLIAACEQQKETRCTFAGFDGGLSFAITEFTEFSDVRLVYAPPESVGDFGGETDNWSWPRHTGDFSLVRVYQDGKPFAPHDFFPVSTEGVKPYDAVAVLGYPGQSFRSYVAAEMAERQGRFYPRVRDYAAEAIQILEDEAKRSKEAELATSDEVRSLLNTRKNAEGQLAGLARGRILEKQKAADARVQAWLAAHPTAESKDAGEAAAGLEKVLGERLATWEHDFLLDRPLAKAITWPLTLARKAHETAKPDLEREPGFQERDLPRLSERFERDQKRYHQAVDQRLLRAWVRRAQALPSQQRIAAVDAVFGQSGTPEELAGKISALYGASKLFDLPTRKAMFTETTAQLEARKDPLVALGLALDAERRALKEKRDAWAGAVLRLRPSWRRAVIAEAGRPVAPDANSTLRVTFGRVQGYAPRDAVGYAPQSSLKGALEKHTGKAPFDLPEKIRQASGSPGRWVDAGLGDVPIDFLADCDTTGGNSGSPVIDAKGRLVGVNFDRVWENVANDFGYNPDVARNVSADVRYLLWILEEVEHAPALVAELTAAVK